MADFAEMIYGDAQKTAVGATKGAAEAYQAGAELALKREQIQQSKVKLAQDKEAAKLEKYNRVGNALEAYNKMPAGKAKSAFGNEFLPKMISALGLAEDIDPVNLKMLQGDDNLGAYLVSQVRSGAMTQEQLQTALKDPVGMAALTGKLKQFGDASTISDTVGAYAAELDEADKFSKTEEGKAARAATVAAGGIGRQERGQAFQATQADKANAEALGRKLVELGIPNLKVTIGKLNDKVIPNGLDNYRGEEIPGIGGKQNLIPAGQLSQAARNNRMMFQDLTNDYIKMITGQGVGVQEAVRLGNALGFDMAIGEGGGAIAVFKGTKSARDMVNGVKNLRDKMRETELALKAGAGVNAATMYEENRKTLQPVPEFKISAGTKTAYAKLSAEAKAAAIKNTMNKFRVTEEQARKELEGK